MISSLMQQYKTICHSREKACCQRRDCFVAALLAMTKGLFSCHCERFEESRGNLKRHFGTFSTDPKSGIYKIRYIPGSLLSQGTCLACLWHSRPSPSLNPALRWSKLEAATRFPSILLCGSLIPIVVYRDGDGFPLAKHVLRRDDSA